MLQEYSLHLPSQHIVSWIPFHRPANICFKFTHSVYSNVNCVHVLAEPQTETFVEMSILVYIFHILVRMLDMISLVSWRVNQPTKDYDLTHKLYSLNGDWRHFRYGSVIFYHPVSQFSCEFQKVYL